MDRTISDMNSKYKFQEISRIFTRVSVCTDRQTECINTLQILWKVLKKREREKESDDKRLTFGKVKI